MLLIPLFLSTVYFRLAYVKYTGLELCTNMSTSTEIIGNVTIFFFVPDGYELPSDGRQKVYPNGTLLISSAVKATDEGYYTCTASNRRDESDSGNVHIQVMSELKMTYIP